MREKIFKEINQERTLQDNKWGEQNHKPIEWIAILTEEVGEASKEAVDFHFNKNSTTQKYQIKRCREELVQVAAVAIAIIEYIDRNNHDLNI